MNRKEAIVVGTLLITTFFGSAFAAPAVQNMLIVNDPLNVRIVGGTSSPQTTSVDIEVLRLFPGATSTSGQTTGSLARGYTITGQPPFRFDFTSAFSFTPMVQFMQVNSVIITISLAPGAYVGSSALAIRLNGQVDTLASIPALCCSLFTLTATLPVADLRVGSNLLSIGVEVPPNSDLFVYFYEIRLTVGYTFLG